MGVGARLPVSDRCSLPHPLTPNMTASDGIDLDVDTLLDEVGFDPERNILTKRQAEVLVLRDRGIPQQAIADELETSRANVANIEASARSNIDRAEETLRFVEAIQAPVQVAILAGSDIYDVPDAVYAACDEADIKVDHSAPDLMKRVLDANAAVVSGRTVETPLSVIVKADGEVLVRRKQSEDSA